MFSPNTTIMPDQLSILIFKTNLKEQSDLVKVEPALVALKEIVRWTVDHEDIDKVLRVETTVNEPQQIIHRLQHLGFHCEELAD